MLVRLVTSRLSPGGRHARLTVLVFHRILEGPDPLLPDEPDAARFDSMLHWLAGQFRVLPLDDALDALYAGTLPARAAAITFDDGYRDNVEIALPILLRHGVAATFFIATGFLDGRTMFNDRLIHAVRVADDHLDATAAGAGTLPTRTLHEKRAAIDVLLPLVKRMPLARREEVLDRIEAGTPGDRPASPMMTADDVRRLHAEGMRIGAHTRDHPVLAAVDDDTAAMQVVSGADDLAVITGRRPRILAYPNGRPGSDFDARHVRMAAACGFDYAVSTAPGAASADTGRYQLPRFTPWDRTRSRFGYRLLQNLRAPDPSKEMP